MSVIVNNKDAWYVKLICAAICQNVTDTKSPHEYIRNKAIDWLQNDPIFDLFCECFDLDKNQVIKTILAHGDWYRTARRMDGFNWHYK